MAYEIALMWCAVIAYALASALFIGGMTFGKPVAVRWAVAVSGVGLPMHVAALIIRWVRVGHAPYLGFYEVVSAYALATVATFLLLAWWRPGLRSLGVALMPLAFLVIGAAMFADKSSAMVTGSLASLWLTVHIGFARVAFACYAAAFALGVAYLLRDRPDAGRAHAILDKLPSRASMDSLSLQFIGAGTLFLAVMIAAGAIWANEAWGRYWGWDPIETWSLATWLTYAVYLHLRLTMGWKGRRAAWFAIAALPVMAFTAFAAPVVYNSIHGAYLQGL